jgi:ArsR family transcriptional regulator
VGDRAVVVEAVAEGRRLCEADGSLARLPLLVAARAEPSLQFFDDEEAGDSAVAVTADDPSPVLAHLAALGPLLPERRLAIDVGCGDGFLLDVLAPLYERVIAVDRSPAQLARCARRVRERGYAHVRLYNGPFDDTELFRQVDEQGGADLVYASRLLHHVPQPARAVGAFCRLLRPGGHLVLLDYLPHEDEDMRQQGDVWLGFSEQDLGAPCLAAGLEVLAHHPIPDAWHPNGADKHLRWQALIARRPNRHG